MGVPYYSANDVEHLLDLEGCIAAMKQAMMALSGGADPQPLRQIVKLSSGGLFGVMPGELSRESGFGCKLVSVFADPAAAGRSRHRGVVAVFSGETGEIACLADAEAVTTIRTACATAMATDLLARPDAKVLTIMGTGTQARSHARALMLVRPFEEVRIWGRDPDRAQALAAELGSLGLPTVAVADGREAATGADVICTVSSSQEPILLREWLGEGVHVNLVGSSFLGPVEVDSALVAAGRYFADYSPSALAQASEFAVARDAGFVDDSHIAGEIGEVALGSLAGRTAPSQLTIYKSLGHVVQDLAAAAYVHSKAASSGEHA